MADEQISIEITDGVAGSISTKIDRIAASATKAHGAIESLKQQLLLIDGKGLQSLADAMKSAASASTKLNQAQQATNKTAAQSAILNNRVETSAAQAATAQQRLATASAQTATAQQRLTSETARTAAAQSNSAAASSRAEQAALRLQQAQKKLEEQNNKTTSSFVEFAKQALSVAAIAAATVALLTYADAYTTLQNKLQTVASSQEQVNELTASLYDLANETRTSVAETATAFTRFDRALALMGKSQEETLRMTETVNKALIVSGATAQESASSLLQLSQAFNSGRLQGDEFRAVSENMPVVLDAVAKALNKPVDQVKKLGSEGKITSEVLFKAFKLIEDQIDSTFAKTVPTIGQAMVVLNNQVGEFIGKVDKATGISAAFAAGILMLGDNIDVLAVAVVAAGAALLVAFGPALAGALVTARNAMLGFTAALAANPIGLLVVALSAAVASIIIFGDQIAVTRDGLVNLQDVFKALFSFVGDGFSAVADLVQSVWGSAIDWLSSKTDGWADRFASLGDSIVAGYKAGINTYIGLWVAAFNSVMAVWDTFPALMSGVFAAVVNAGAESAEDLVNGWQTGLRSIVDAAAEVAPEMAKRLGGALDAVKLELPRMEIDQQAKDAGSRLAKGVADAFKTDYLAGIGGAITGRAREIAKARKVAEAASAGSNLRGAGVNTLSGDDGSKTKKQKLTQEQKDYNKALKEVTAPLREYNAAIAVADALYSSSAISLEKYNTLVSKAKTEYAAATDPLYSFNKATQEQLDILEKVGPAMEAERNVIQARNAALQAGLPWSNAMAESIRQTSEALDVAQGKSDVMNQIYSETTGAQQQLVIQQQAYNQALANGALSAEQYSIRMQQLAVDSANLKMQMGDAGFVDVLTAGLGQLVSGYNGVLQGLSDSFGQFFTGFVDGFADSIGRAIVYGDSLKDSFAELSRQIVSQLISALVKLGVQYVINQTLGATAMAASTAASVVAGTATAAAWAPAAAMVSLASFGANAAPAATGITSTAVLAQGLSVALPGFETGGYTGSGGTSEVAGLVHGQEFVMTAEATRRNRPTLEAMNRGGNVGTGESPVNVTVINNASGAKASVEYVSKDDVRVIVQDELDNSFGPRMTSELSDTYSDSRQLLNSEYNIQRNTTS